MCGIAGVIARDAVRDDERAAVDVMLDRLAHRGPDGSGRYDDRHAALGHRRLAVISRKDGRQPMTDERGRIHSIVNGEFYNFRELRDQLRARGHGLLTQCDAECLPHLYEEHGEACLDPIIGMFALAIWDSTKRTAFLARDRLGVKPLYYHADDRRIVFASELKAILVVPGVPTDLDAAALLDFLTFGFIPSPRTIFRGIRKLPAAHLLTWQDSRLVERPYWDLRYAGWPESTAAQSAESLWEQLTAATERRLLADVPLGAFFSGGLDSTAVLAAMAGLLPSPPRAVTSGFAEESHDERPHARAVADRLGIDFREILIHADAAARIDQLTRHFDEPFADPSALPLFELCRLGRRHFTVALTGDGGDEILAGYRRYRFDRREETVRRWTPRLVRRHVFGAMASVYPSRPWMPRSLRAGSTLRNLAVDSAEAHAFSISTLAPHEARNLLHPDLASQLGDYDPFDAIRGHYARCDAPDHLSKCQYTDIRFGLADGILTKVDRASMAHGMEIRSPLLDHRLAEFAWTIHPKHRIRGNEGKAPLRDALRSRLGDAIASRPKAGFDVPLDAWFRGPLGDDLRQRLYDPSSPLAPWLSLDTALGRFKHHQDVRLQDGPTLWKLFMLDNWARHLTDAPVAAPLRHEIVSEPACTLNS